VRELRLDRAWPIRPGDVVLFFPSSDYRYPYPICVAADDPRKCAGDTRQRITLVEFRQICPATPVISVFSLGKEVHGESWWILRG
jgi:hypothetical protein